MCLSEVFSVTSSPTGVLCWSVAREKGRSIEKVTIFSCFIVHGFSVWYRHGCCHPCFNLQAAFLQYILFICTCERLLELDLLKNKCCLKMQCLFLFAKSYCQHKAFLLQKYISSLLSTWKFFLFSLRCTP